MSKNTLTTDLRNSELPSSDDMPESSLPADSASAAPLARSSGGTGDGNDEPKVGRNVPRAE